MADTLYYTFPFFHQRYFDNDGNPLAGGSLTFYSAGSTVLKPIYLDQSGVQAANPLPLDSTGLPIKQYFGEAGEYDIYVKDSNGVIIDKKLRIAIAAGSATTDKDLHRYYAWFMMDSTYTVNPPVASRSQISVSDIQTMLEFGYCCTGNTQTTSTITTSLWYVTAYDSGTDTATWREEVIDTNSEVINLDRAHCNYLQPHPDRPLNETETYTTYPAGLYTLVATGDGFFWKPLVVKEFPEPSYAVTGALIYDAALSAYRWIALDEIGGKVKIDSTDLTAGYLADKLIADNDANSNKNIVFTKIGADGTNKQYGAHVDTDVIYDEILTKMNPPSYDLFGSYPDEVGICQLTGIGAALKAKSLEDANGNPLAWQTGTGQNGANYGRSCIPGYAYVKNATGTKVRKRVWCAFGSTGEIYNSFDRYQSTTHDNSLVIADSTYSRIPAGNSGLSCAAYIKDGTDYYWFVGGFIDNYIYLLHDVADSYNDDGTFKSTAWIWTACPTLPTNIAHICSVKTGGFLYTGYHLGGLNYKATIAGAGSQVMTNPDRRNKDVIGVFTGDGHTTVFDFYAEEKQSYNGAVYTAKDSNGNTVAISNCYRIPVNNQFEVEFQTAPASGLVVTVTVSSDQYNAGYTGAGLSGLGSDHYGTYNVIDRDTGRIYSNTTEALTGTFTNSHVENGTTISDWKLLSLYVRESDSDNYPATTTDRLGTCYGNITGDPYTWWSGLQSAYGLWVATIALKQYASDPIYAYSDDGIHWTKYTDGVGIGTSSTLAIWDSQSDGMNWYVTNMYASSPLIFELLVNSIPAHKRVVAEKGIGISGDAFLVDLPSTPILGTDENGKIVAGNGEDLGVLVNLDDLKNVSTASKTDGQVLAWDNTAGVWKPVTGGSGGGSTVIYAETMHASNAIYTMYPYLISDSELLVKFHTESNIILTNAVTKLGVGLIQGGTGNVILTVRDSAYNLIASTIAGVNPTGAEEYELVLNVLQDPSTFTAATTYTLSGGSIYYLGINWTANGIAILGDIADSLKNILPYPSVKMDNLTGVPNTLTGGSEHKFRPHLWIKA